MPKLDNETILIVFIAVTALAMLLQTIFLLALLLTMRKMARSLREEAEDLRSSVMPIVYNTRELISRLTPKIEGTIDNLAQIAESLRKQTIEMQSTANEAVERVQNQVLRLDAMLTGALDAAERAGGFVVASVRKPVRQFAGMMASVKAVVDTLRSPAPRKTQPDSSFDNDTY